MRRIIYLSFCLLILIAAGVYLYIRLNYGKNTLPPQYYQNHKISQSAAKFTHVVIVMEENKPQSEVIGNQSAPYINQLASQYALDTNYYAVTNPSLPNYLALTSGTTAGINNDCNPPGGSCVANVSNIADRLERAGLSWKEYAESMPTACYGLNSSNYAVKHNPFMYYPDITGDTKLCQSHVVPFTKLSSDLKTAQSFPDYAFITPNLCDDMHDCSVSQGDSWLAQLVPRILASPAFTTEKSLLVITWDEGDLSNNNVPVIFAGPAAKKHYTSKNYFSHYSLLHTIENNWGLAPLTKNDKSAPLMTDMLR